VDIVFLDYRKAFDSVNHAKLIEKLMLANVDLTVIKWIAAFLLGRKMRVKVRMEFSDCSVESSNTGICVRSFSVLGVYERLTTVDQKQ